MAQIDAATQRRLDALARMTVDRGCTPGEARAAAEAVKRIKARYGAAPESNQAKARERTAEDLWKARDAFRRAGFEFRQCWKPACRCMRGGAWHGPYRYAKRQRGKGRKGRTVYSVYQGKR